MTFPLHSKTFCLNQIVREPFEQNVDLKIGVYILLDSF